jgi:hypothetical protein
MKVELQTIEHLNRLSNYTNFKLTLEDNISTKEILEISKFKIKYQLLQLINFSDEKILNETIQLGEKILDLNY